MPRTRCDVSIDIKTMKETEEFHRKEQLKLLNAKKKAPAFSHSVEKLLKKGLEAFRMGV